MKEYQTQNIRNIALVSHSSAGKTMLAEAFLHFTGETTRLGRIEDGSTVSDYDEEEVRRGISLSTSVIPIEYNDHKINVLDTPGYTDFVGEVISALRVSDGAMIVVDSVAGVEVGTEIAWNYCDEFNLPRLVVINKMNRDNADFAKALASVQAISEARLIPVELPWGEKADFQGVIDLLTMKAYPGNGEKAEDIPAEFVDVAEEARMELIEAAAEGEDELLLKYLDGEDLSADEILVGFQSGVQSGVFVPVFVASGTHEIGIAQLLKGIIKLIPSPDQRPPVIAQGAGGVDEEISAVDSGPLAAYVWKTTADPFVGKITYFRVYSGSVKADSRVWNNNAATEERFGGVSLIRGKDQIPVKIVHAGDIASVSKLGETSTGHTFCDKGHPVFLPVPNYPSPLFQVAVSPQTQADSAKISPTLTRICEEDMTLAWEQVRVTKQTVLKGMGDQHIAVAIRKAASKFQTNLDTEAPRIPYQETIRGKGDAQYRHKKQSGGAGQFGDVTLSVSSTEEDYEFSWDVFGGAISQNYQPAIEKGVKNVMRDGVLAGYPVHNVKVSVYDGKEHPVDSKPVAFEIAAREAFRLAFKKAQPVLLEPIMDVKVTVPEANMGDILGDLNTRRARVQGMNSEKGKSIVEAHVPLAEMQRYTADLRSMTGGRGMFSMEFVTYEVVPTHLTQDIIDAAQKEKEE